MSVLVFSHEQDVDGLFSAAVLKIAFPEAEIILTNYGLENMVAVGARIFSFVSLNKGSSGTIIIADIGVNEESHQPVFEALKYAKGEGFATIWIDHHLWPDGMRQKFSQQSELVIHFEANGTKKCSTELCTEKFASNNPLARTLAAMAHRTDFPDSAKFPIPPLTGLISYYLGSPQLKQKLLSVILKNVRQGMLWNIEMQEDMIEASRLIDESISRSIESKVLKEFEIRHPDFQGGIKPKVAIVKADPFVSRSILLGRIMDESEIDLAIAYTSDGKISIRRKDNPSSKMRLNCSVIASRFKEGGGHEGAAGGFLHSDIQGMGDDAAIKEISGTLKDYFEKFEL